jgi:flagellar motor component MotA
VFGTLYACVIRGFKKLRGMKMKRMIFAGALLMAAAAVFAQQAGSFLKTAGESTATFTGICVVESVMDMLIKLEDRAGIGPRLAFALIGIIYGTLLYLIILAAHGVVRKKE